MIPRIIHYCWFGRNAKPPAVRRCIAGWRRILPDYRFVEWNEDNFDVQSSPYVAEAYRARKFAFVSDVARGHALYSQGGIYLDTDVEVLKPFDPLLKFRSFWGFEVGNFVATSTFGAVKGHELISEYLDGYAGRSFLFPDGSCDVTTNVTHITRILVKHGLVLDDGCQTIGNNNIVFSSGYLSPYDYRTGKMADLADAYAIHHYSVTWSSPWARCKGMVKRCVGKIPGVSALISTLQAFSRNR